MTARQGLAALLPLVLASPLAAASFDCTHARAADEKAICADRSLNDRDVRMALLFDLDQRFLPMGGRDALRRGQAAWLLDRRQCGANIACLSRSYDRRIGELRGVIDERVYPKGPF